MTDFIVILFYSRVISGCNCEKLFNSVNKNKDIAKIKVTEWSRYFVSRCRCGVFAPRFGQMFSASVTADQWKFQLVMDARSAMRPCYILPMFFIFLYMAALVGQTAERIFTKLSHVVDIRCYLRTY